MQNLGHLESEYGIENDSCRMAKMNYQKLNNCNIESIFEQGLHEFVGAFLTDNDALASQIERDYRFRA